VQIILTNVHEGCTVEVQILQSSAKLLR